MTRAVLAFTPLLAAANGSNDDPKGVATLGGARLTGYRHALAWEWSAPWSVPWSRFTSPPG